MARTMEVVSPEEDRPRRPAGPRRTRVVVKKVGPWSVLRFSLLFYFCIMIAFWIGFLLHLVIAEIWIRRTRHALPPPG